MVRKFSSLKLLAEFLNWEWPSDMMDVVPTRCPLVVCDTEDEVYVTHPTVRRRVNHDTRDGWLQRLNTPQYSSEHQCMLTRAHYGFDSRMKLYGSLESPDRKARSRAWRESHPDRVRELHQINRSREEYKDRVRERHESAWVINRDIELKGVNSAGYTWVKKFNSGIPYRWSTLDAYYGGSITEAISDGWIKQD